MQGKSNIRWAMAARSKSKLEKVRSDLAKINPAMKVIMLISPSSLCTNPSWTPSCWPTQPLSQMDVIWKSSLVLQDVPILVADATDQASIDSVVKQAKVVIACAGPYAKLGTPVVDACVRLGAHCVDITGTPANPGNKLCQNRHAKAAKRLVIPKSERESRVSRAGVLVLLELNWPHNYACIVMQARFRGCPGPSESTMMRLQQRKSRLSTCVALTAYPQTWGRIWWQQPSSRSTRSKFCQDPLLLALISHRAECCIATKHACSRFCS